jgi:tetratricopeptide (TPR) repeat protein
MLTAVRNLPPSLLREEHEHIYDLIDRWLNDKQLEHEALPVPRALMEPETGEPSAIQRSHRTTRTLLERARNTLSQGEQINSSQLTEEIYSHAWWWESERTLDEGVFFFPAVRLALVAIGQQLGIPDPGAAFISDRIRANKLREEYRWAYSYARSDHPDPEHAKERLEEALKALESQSRLMPLDETLWLDRGYTLLLLQRPEEAVEVLRHCLALPWCRGNTLASAHYDLACAYSLMGRESECSMELEETLQVQPAFRQEISTESFLEAMRTKEWFSHLVNG